MLEKFKGTGVALVTPFDSTLKIDYSSLQKLLAYTASNGVDYYVVQGTTGESPTTSANEKKAILEFIKENNRYNLPIVYGIGGNNTNQVLDTIKETDLSGVDALLSVAPYYNKPAQAGYIKHYAAIADASPVPVMLYNVPGRTGSNIEASTTIELAKHPNIIATKEASGDMVQCMQIMHEKPDDFLLISGDDMLTVPIMSMGGSGIISVLANAFPHIFHKMVRHCFEGDFKEATKNACNLLEINPLMYKESNPTGVKQVLKEFGICENYLRLPLERASQDLEKDIKKALKEMDLKEVERI
ncbi:4-hydroxy-tetrahydrodipicolinate synthase [Fulvivirgaceae bacterium BMA10]|uniref:4-hydroxy-tetrahydrodipicolinate synthase n=1 Tax=Splendidivirga corallicola TaxID=3051826 RepID=A0ABT8KIC9_9BACT|nr:4-hydroxy-tetrahydrodipicolinate synthase [Fulvivirgaceae bacterium BMA10]